MKSFFLFLGLIGHLAVFSQQSYWQQETNYIIEVRLNDSEHTLDGFLRLDYINHSPDTISFIWFHLWPNAFKNDRTAFSEQLLQNGRTDFYFSGKEDRGYINRLDFRTSNTSLRTEDHPLYIDVIKVYLQRPLAPSEKVEITTPFHVKIPKNFSRGGHTGRSYQITQWYPKPAVYDRKGWHPMPYLDQGEFYSDFGKFDVRISVPKPYIVAATGELQHSEFGTLPTGRQVQNSEDKHQQTSSEVVRPKSNNTITKKKTTSFKKSGTKSSAPKNKSYQRKSKASRSKQPVRSISPVQMQQPIEYKTLRYTQENVHDFAWFADKKFIVESDTILLASGKVVRAYSYRVSENSAWQNSIRYMKDAIRFRSLVMGEYPFNTVSVVEAKMGFEGGMEYPTITSISPTEDESELEELIEHEIGHNWLQGVLASNEREHPWMDEGINSYYDARYQEWKDAGKNINGNSLNRGKIPENPETLLLDAYARQKLDQPITTSSEKFTQVNYFLAGYAKMAQWMKQLEDSIGRDQIDKCLQEYYSRWRFKHPYPEDFTSFMQSCANRDLVFHVRALDQKGSLYPQKRKIKPAFLFSLNNGDKFSYINFFPAVGYNKYDGFMVGCIVHNYNIPSERFQFVAVPLYATGSKQLNGLGSVSYSVFPDSRLQRIQLGVSAARFSLLKGIDSNSNEIFGRFSKIVPSLRITFKNRSERSTVEKWLEWKTFLIGERGFNYVEKSRDSTFYPTEASNENRYLNQLVFNITDYRKLYPYDLQLQIQQGSGFYRANAIAHYFYNYAKGGGMQVRFFASKFGYLGSQTPSKEFETAIFQPKLTAVRGNEDYTYSNMFLGRNESENFLSQQIMMRDGGLKLRTDLFQGLQGRSDNWVTSLNFSTSLPQKLFPVKLPLKIFFDVGTYAEAWKKEATTSRFLYVGGLQVSLFKNMVNIYAPLVYSSEFRDNLKTVPEENKFFQRLSFSIDLHRFDLRRIVGYKVPI